MSDLEAAMIELMKSRGGAFVRNLAWTYVSADPDNRRKLRAAFEDLFRGYQDWAESEQAAAAPG